MPTPNYMPPDDENQQNPRGGLPRKPVQGNDMAAIFTALAQYLQAQPGLQQKKLALAQDIGTGVSTNPHDMLYGSQNPSAFYNPDHDAYWKKTFGGR